MNRRIKLLSLLIILLILILLTKSLLNVKISKYSIKYDDNEVYIEERLDNSEYQIKISYLDKNYFLRLNQDLNGKRKIINNIYYFKDDNYECLLPVIENGVYNDFMCYKDDIIYNYHNIFGSSQSLDEYVNSINIYDINKFIDNLNKVKNIKNVKIYTNNLENINFSISTYDGIISSNGYIKLFDKDVYNNKLSTFVDNYYVVADYNNNYEFKNFYIIDITTNKVSILKSKYEISFDSYIEGIVDNKIYLYDKDNEIQYEIDVKNKKINIVSTENSIKFYKNGKWENLKKTKIFNELCFEYGQNNNKYLDYDKVIETDKYYYLFKINNNGYDLYRIDKGDTNIITFISNLNADFIIANDNYLYFVYKNKLYYYSDITGIRTILEYNELEYNDTIKYYISKTYFK